MHTHSKHGPATPATPATPAIAPAAMVAKSAVCVAIVAGLAWVGVSSLGTSGADDRSVEAAASAAGVTIRGDRAATHRREVFEARRARFEARDATQVAGGHFEHPAP